MPLSFFLYWKMVSTFAAALCWARCSGSTPVIAPSNPWQPFLFWRPTSLLRHCTTAAQRRWFLYLVSLGVESLFLGIFPRPSPHISLTYAITYCIMALCKHLIELPYGLSFQSRHLYATSENILRLLSTKTWVACPPEPPAAILPTASPTQPSAGIQDKHGDTTNWISDKSTEFELQSPRLQAQQGFSSSDRLFCRKSRTISLQSAFSV